MNAGTGLLAADATTAIRHAGACFACSRAILRGHRYARLLTGRLVHVTCCASMMNNYAGHIR